MNERGIALWLGAGLVLAVVVLYSPTFGYGFVEYDDREFLVRSPAIQEGLSLSSLRWALTASVAGNWHPVTLVSHLVDSSLFGKGPAWGGHHATNVLLHALNSLLVMLVGWRLSGRLLPSAFVAALFAVHPLSVEPVAWISQRKTLLSTTFAWGTVLAWLAWSRRPTKLRYLLALGLFALGLASKAMLVTLPCVLLLLDYWPLRRLGAGRGLSSLVFEKLPFFALAVLSSLGTLSTQRATGALAPVDPATIFFVTAPNALLGYAWYLAKLVWPFGLAVHYPHPYLLSAGGVPPTASGLLAASLVVAAATLACFAPQSIRARRWPAVAWLFFVGSLVPVIGFVQVGTQAVADRYAYWPGVGCFALFCGAAVLAARRLRLSPPMLWGAALLLLMLLAVQSSYQLEHWRSSRALYERAVAISPRDSVMLFNLGNATKQDGDHPGAMSRYREALAVSPGQTAAQLNLADLLQQSGEPAALLEAIPLFERVLEERPDSRRARRGLRLARRELRVLQREQGKAPGGEGAP